MKQRNIILKFRLGVFVLFIFTISFAQAEVSPADSSIEQELLKSNKIISVWFDKVAEKVDLYLAGKRVTTEKNNSSIVFENTTYSRESENFSNLSSISFNPRFPNLEAYWNLKFTNFDDMSTSTASEKGYARQTPKDQNYGASVGLFKKLENIKYSFQPRVELKNPLSVSHSIAAEGSMALGRFVLNPKLQFFASSTKGTGSFQALNFVYNLNDFYSLSLLNEGEYEDRLNRYSVTNGISLGQLVSDKTAMSYGVSFYSNNRPVYHLDAYSFSITWTQVIYPKVLDFQLGPHLDFVQEEHFHGFAGLVFSLKVRF